MSEQKLDSIEQLDNPFVVHKESDASYNGCPNLNMLTETRDEEDDVHPTIERHRFKKKKKNPNKTKAITIVLLSAVVIVCVCVVVYFVRGAVSQNSTKSEPETETVTESLRERFRNTVTVQGTTIFFEGEEMTDVAELRNYLSLLPSDTQVIIQDEHADVDFFQTVQETVYACGFEKDPDVEYIESSGLVAQSSESETADTQ